MHETQVTTYGTVGRCPQQSFCKLAILSMSDLQYRFGCGDTAFPESCVLCLLLRWRLGYLSDLVVEDHAKEVRLRVTNVNVVSIDVGIVMMITIIIVIMHP